MLDIATFSPLLFVVFILSDKIIILGRVFI